MLQDGVTSGFVILKPDSSDYPFNRGLPSWNGTVPDDECSFFIQVRFPLGSGWSPWLLAGYWKEYLWGSYGTTGYSEGYIDYDYVKLNVYKSSWQYKIYMERSSAEKPSPTVTQLSFFISDTRTTDAVNYTEIINDNPEAIFIPTDFLYQYSIDPDIGGSICSPTSVSMILRSYGIEVDPLKFARDTRDPYFNLFGIWPRVVQNASEYGVTGSVTRYRTWSDARDVLAAGGRIAMSVGNPLYSGHLMMLAGFTADGTPIVHDPAKYNGYSYTFNKYDLSRSWFDKGGISYTFFETDSFSTDVRPVHESGQLPEYCILLPNYPNPFNSVTHIGFSLERDMPVRISVFDTKGRAVETLYDDVARAGQHTVTWCASSEYPSGIYYIRLTAGSRTMGGKALLLK
ncbi:C39 family peptidase [bacterium]|nr:C39 family peptidase [bacterium]